MRLQTLSSWHIVLKITVNICQHFKRTEHFTCGVSVLPATLWVATVVILSSWVMGLSSER